MLESAPLLLLRSCTSRAPCESTARLLKPGGRGLPCPIAASRKTSRRSKTRSRGCCACKERPLPGEIRKASVLARARTRDSSRRTWRRSFRNGSRRRPRGEGDQPRGARGVLVEALRELTERTKRLESEVAALRAGSSEHRKHARSERSSNSEGQTQKPPDALRRRVAVGARTVVSQSTDHSRSPGCGRRVTSPVIEFAPASAIAPRVRAAITFNRRAGRAHGFDGNDDSVWIVRRINLSLQPGSTLMPEKSRLRYQSLGRALAKALTDDGDGTNAIRFAPERPICHEFLTDVAAGTAWTRWYFAPLSGWRLLSASAAIRSALVEDPVPDSMRSERSTTGSWRRLSRVSAPRG